MNSKFSHLLLFVALGAIITTACKREEDPEPEVDVMYIKSQTIHWTIGGNHDGGDHDSDPFVKTEFAEFNYDSQGRLIKANDLEFVYNENGKLIKTIEAADTIYYLYENGILSALVTNCGYYDGGSFVDSTQFFYTNEVLTHSLSSHEQSRTDFAFNGSGNITSKFISRVVSGTMKYDSLVYTWENGNLTSIGTKSGHPYVSYLYLREYRYDNYPSYLSAIHYPKEYLFVREITQFYGKYPLFYYQSFPWRFNCVNNPIEFVENNNHQVRVNPYSIWYNTLGYPVKIYGKEFEMDLFYK